MTAPGYSLLNSLALSSERRSTLLRHSIVGLPWAPSTAPSDNSESVRLTVWISSSTSSLEASAHSTRTSASLAASSVEAKECTSCVGIFLINPTVSVTMKSGRAPSWPLVAVPPSTRRVVVSRVSKSLSFVDLLAPLNAFRMVVFPALVYPTSATLGGPPFFNLAPRTDLAASSSLDRKSTRLNSSHANISYAVFCLKKQKSHG